MLVWWGGKRHLLTFADAALHTDIQLIQNLPRMPRTGIVYMAALGALLISGEWVPLQQQHVALNLENSHPNENVKRFNALVLSKKG